MVPFASAGCLTALHLLPYRLAAVHSVGVKFYPYTIWVKAAEIDLNLEYVFLPVTRYLHFAEAQLGPVAVPECAAN